MCVCVCVCRYAGNATCLWLRAASACLRDMRAECLPISLEEWFCLRRSWCVSVSVSVSVSVFVFVCVFVFVFVCVMLLHVACCLLPLLH